MSGVAIIACREVVGRRLQGLASVSRESMIDSCTFTLVASLLLFLFLSSSK